MWMNDKNFRIKDFRQFQDSFGKQIMRFLILLISLLFILILGILIFKSSLILSTISFNELLFSDTWNPEKGNFGLYPIIIGTIFVTGLSLLIAIPVSILTAVYITEYTHRKMRQFLRSFIDVLAGVPSVVFGLCAFLFLVPLVKDVVAPWFGVESTGLCIFTAAITLSVMVFPFIISLCIDSFSSIPIELKEASLSVGATKWETVKKVIFRTSKPSVIAAILLGFGRAFGETIAVNMVVGGIPKIPGSFFDPGQTLASLIASAYGELMSVPLFESALMFVALILLVVVLLFNLVSVFIIRHSQKMVEIP
jgi:phosphate transport system permease protein